LDLINSLADERPLGRQAQGAQFDLFRFVSLPRSPEGKNGGDRSSQTQL